ncbi:Piso0_003939 [Millerozyma farinosa CBS 7064]|uniref:Piso0_003939 protein n=1 Tax=Pichia sorbitophila (strain ATCC MYA-4447 / BCRC 22081 / CBS 7064 / NBRC 10061 / NRRL Y-12695) TaxID=559304 RepID=G8Y715_PICSO|nr:Piso0_003939 [Millerozyma farinosa CBS 7064]CCE84395.1 Piso0_003939 [Millerozyma farinosa CBS 7064]
MSFFNTIRGFGRNSKKNKKDIDPSSPFYTHSNGSGSPLRRNGSPTRPAQAKPKNPQIQFVNQQSPTRGRNVGAPTGQYRQGLAKRRSRTFASGSQGDGNLPLFLCEPFVKTALVKGSFKTIVQLPKYVDYGEWLALNIFEMFNNLNQFYGIFAEYVTPEQYPSMNAGPTTNYMWIDSNGQQITLPACQYIDYVLTWITGKLNDQSVFPTKNGGAFPPYFLKDCKNIVRQMFRIFAFLYHNQFDKIVHLSLEAHWNSFFAHFISFTKEFNLINRQELEPLLPLIENLEQQGKII